MKVAVFRARHLLVAISLAILLALASTLAAPVLAQEETPTQPGDETWDVSRDQNVSSGQYAQSEQGSGQQAGEDGAATAARVSESLQGADALIIENGSDDTAGRIRIDAADCEVEEKGAIVTVDGDESGSATFTNSPDTALDTDDVEATIEPSGDQVIIEVIDDTNLAPEFGNDENGTVASSSGITCGRDAAANAGGGNENGGDDAKTADELKDLSCDELLVLFRAEGSSAQGQYGDASGFADADVRAQVEVCLENEIVKGTAADGDLPDTGGLSLIGLAVLGVASAAAGLSVVRGRR